MNEVEYKKSKEIFVEKLIKKFKKDYRITLTKPCIDMYAIYFESADGMFNEKINARATDIIFDIKRHDSEAIECTLEYLRVNGTQVSGGLLINKTFKYNIKKQAIND